MNNQMNNGVGQVNQLQNQNLNNNSSQNVKKMAKSVKLIQNGLKIGLM